MNSLDDHDNISPLLTLSGIMSAFWGVLFYSHETGKNMTLINQSSELWQYVAELGVLMHEHQRLVTVDSKSYPWCNPQELMIVQIDRVLRKASMELYN
jgi:hypothetical protein